MPPVAVLVPGIMGSELRLAGEVIWPGPILSLLLPYRKMAQLLDPGLVATDVIRKYAFSTQYQALVDDLGACGFTESDQTLVVFPYDWRKPNELAARQLADRLDAVVEAHGADVEISLVVHSMGGLIARYYLESGAFADRPGFGRVRRLVSLATPHRGAPLALPRLLGQEKVLWLSAAQVREAANDPRYPAPYQLLPPAGEPFAWNDAADAEYTGLDLYDARVAAAIGLVPESLDAARAFHARLDPARRPAGVRYFCFSGTRQTTASLAAFLPTADGFQVRKVERDSAGDGTVPFWSSALPGVQCLAVGGEHSVIYKDRGLRRALAAVLGRAGALGELEFAPGGPPVVQVAVRDRVTEPGKTVHLTLEPVSGDRRLDGELRVERADDSDTASPVFHPAGAPQRVQYQGPAAESFGLLLPAPAQPGAYRVAYYPAGATAPAGADALFVQEPVR